MYLEGKKHFVSLNPSSVVVVKQFKCIGLTTRASARHERRISRIGGAEITDHPTSPTIVPGMMVPMLCNTTPGNLFQPGQLHN